MLVQWTETLLKNLKHGLYAKSLQQIAMQIASRDIVACTQGDKEQLTIRHNHNLIVAPNLKLNLGY